jgi:ComF family protein
MTTLAQRISRTAFDLIFPPQCALCGSGGTLLCDVCADTLPLASGQRCDRCFMPSTGSLCRHCQLEPPAFGSLRSAFVMDAGARRLAHELKYERMTSLAGPMASLLAQVAEFDGIDLVVPVPLHGRRERSRGYNQSAELARRIAAIVALPCEPKASRRTRDTAPLAKAMNREERRSIVAGAFAADRRRVDHQRILLVDDVCTTGATLDACSKALLNAGAESVRCLVWARAD